MPMTIYELLNATKVSMEVHGAEYGVTLVWQRAAKRKWPRRRFFGEPGAPIGVVLRAEDGFEEVAFPAARLHRYLHRWLWVERTFSRTYPRRLLAQETFRALETQKGAATGRVGARAAGVLPGPVPGARG